MEKILTFGSPKLCRMLAVIPQNQSKLDTIALQEFRQLAKSGKVPPGSKPCHGDGWGMVVWLEGQPRYLGREPRDALSDLKFDEACKKIDEMKISSQLLLHLRKASKASVSEPNTHPFIFEKWAFAHNGTIHDIPRNDDVTDSQMFFEMIMKSYHETGMQTAISDTILEIRRKYHYTSITFLLSDGSDLFAYREYTKWNDYYTVYYAKVDVKLFVSQEKFFPYSWKELENRQLLHATEASIDISSIIDDN